MRIVYIHQYFNTPSSSSSTRSFEMARRLASRGHDVHIVTSAREGGLERTEVVENFTVHWLPVAYSQLMSYKERIKAFGRFAIRSARTARNLHGDIVFATSTPLTVAIPGIAATLLRKSPLVFEVRDLWPDAPIAMGALKSKPAQMIARVLEKTTYRYASHIVALSPDMEQAIKAKGVKASKVSVIPNAADNDHFQKDPSEGRAFRDKLPWLSDRKLVLYCGTLGNVNDVSYIARLAAATYDRDDTVRFLVVGKGNDEDVVRENAKALDVYEKNFFMLEPVPKTEVPAIFAAADLSISTVAPIPLLAANSANKVFDSFASGTPLAINHEGWLAKLLRKTDAGIVLEADDFERASKQLVDFFNSPEAMEKASKQSKLLATQTFDRQKLAEQLAEVLERAHNEAGSPTEQKNKPSIS